MVMFTSLFTRRRSILCLFILLILSNFAQLLLFTPPTYYIIIIFIITTISCTTTIQRRLSRRQCSVHAINSVNSQFVALPEIWLVKQGMISTNLATKREKVGYFAKIHGLIFYTQQLPYIVTSKLTIINEPMTSISSFAVVAFFALGIERVSSNIYYPYE